MCAIGVRHRSIGLDHGAHDHPVELAPADDAFLSVLVIIDAPRQQFERRAIQKPNAPRLSPAPDPVTQIDMSLLERRALGMDRLAGPFSQWDQTCSDWG
jgi:hypothetical protein